jgi:hypothetical protein
MGDCGNYAIALQRFSGGVLIGIYVFRPTSLEEKLQHIMVWRGDRFYDCVGSLDLEELTRKLQNSEIYDPLILDFTAEDVFEPPPAYWRLVLEPEIFLKLSLTNEKRIAEITQMIENGEIKS